MMKTFFLITSFFFSVTLLGQSQSHEFTIDYTVKYLIKNKEGTKDTVTVGFEKNGKYLWSDYKGIVKEFASKVMGDGNLPSDSSNIIYSSVDGKLYFFLDIDAFKMTLETEIATMLLMPRDKESSMNEEVELKHEKTDQNFMFNGKKVAIYKVYPDSAPQNAIGMAIDTSYEVDNNFLFQNFLNVILNATSSKGEIIINIPNGIILSMTEPSSNDMLIEAISIDTKSRKISLNNSFKISE